jgi:hypothetical protein
MKRKSFFAVIALVALVLALPGCAQGGADESDPFIVIDKVTPSPTMGAVAISVTVSNIARGDNILSDFNDFVIDEVTVTDGGTTLKYSVTETVPIGGTTTLLVAIPGLGATSKAVVTVRGANLVDENASASATFAIS